MSAGLPPPHSLRALTATPSLSPAPLASRHTAFVTIDVATTILQIAGAALIGVSESARVQGNGSAITPEQANDILLAGLALQVRGVRHEQG